MTVKITVIIPTYKRPRLLIKCLAALAAQRMSKADFEVIVVSDGQDSDTENALANWHNKSGLQVSLYHTEKKNGPAAARNYGWLKAKSKLIAFTDDDCLPDQDWLLSFISAYQGEEMIAFTGNTIVPLPEKKTDFAVNLAQLEHADFITANCACTKQALIKAGGFDERFKMAWREDSDLEFKFILQNIRIVKVERAVVVHPVREVPWGISIKEQKKGIYDALLFKKYPTLYKTRISSGIGHYYGILALVALLLTAIWLSWNIVILLSIAGLTFSFGQLILKRLQNRHRSLSHIMEMITTSIVLPFLSIFWRIYGAIKYRVLFI